MAVSGGSMISVTFAGRLFVVTADASVSRGLGGMTNENRANGDGSARPIKTRVLWSMEGLVVEIDDDRADQEYLQNLSDGVEYFPCVFSYGSGVDYTGLGQFEGDIVYANENAAATIALKGPGKLVKMG